MFLAQTIHIADLAAGIKFEVGEVGVQKDGIEQFRSHDGILQAENVAYSSGSKKFVNRLDHLRRVFSLAFEYKRVDSYR
jgi:hypothetical protein